MGYSNSWLAVRASEEAVLSVLALEKTGHRASLGRRDWSGTQIGDWTVIWSPTFEPKRFRDAVLTLDGEVLVLDVEEHVMFVSASLFKDRRLSWRVVHDAQKSPDHLSAEGTPPEPFSGIRDEELARAGSDPDVDFVFEIPVRLAEELVGFRHDGAGMPAFEILKDIHSHLNKWWKFW